MSTSMGRAKMKTHDAAAPAPSEAERNAIDQVRELLFGETRRSADHRMEDFNTKVDALAAELRARFDKLEAALAALTRDAESRALLAKVAERFGLTARGYHRVLRVARTIADLAGERGSSHFCFPTAITTTRGAP